jgi:AmmeMemoRadiSam system protein A
LLKLDDLQGEPLLDLAIAAISEALDQPVGGASSSPAWLQKPGACFVTLEFGAQLHGCIGTIEARRPLVEDVRRNAVLAAFEDPRSRPLRVDELATIDVAVAVLGPLAPLPFTDERHALAQLRPAIDGLLLRWRARRGVFLPKVWDTLPTAKAFLDQLKRKAGLPIDFWADDLTLERFEVRSFTRLHATR